MVSSIHKTLLCKRFSQYAAFLMAELHILGHINCARNFKESHSLFCRYSFQSGPNWTLVSGCSEGQTTCAKPDYKERAVWSQPIDLHYISKGIQGWPKVIFQVNCLDSIGRSWIVGYGSCSIPASPGEHTLNIPCWVPAATSISDRLRQMFIGGSHLLVQTDIIHLGRDRFKLTTKSKGDIELKIYIILRNFCQFGVEYK